MLLEQALRNRERRTRLLPLAMAFAAAAVCAGNACAAEPKASHEFLDPNSRTDELGIFVPVPISHPGRRFPATMEFPTGPEVGERLPDFTLPNQHGEPVDIHEDRAGRKAVVVFYRSAVW